MGTGNGNGEQSSGDYHRFRCFKSNKRNYGKNRVSTKKSCTRQGLSSGQELEEGGQKRAWQAAGVLSQDDRMSLEESEQGRNKS